MTSNVVEPWSYQEVSEGRVIPLDLDARNFFWVPTTRRYRLKCMTFEQCMSSAFPEFDAWDLDIFPNPNHFLVASVWNKFCLFQVNRKRHTITFHGATQVVPTGSTKLSVAQKLVLLGYEMERSERLIKSARIYTQLTGRNDLDNKFKEWHDLWYERYKRENNDMDVSLDQFILSNHSGGLESDDEVSDGPSIVTPRYNVPIRASDPVSSDLDDFGD